MAIRNARSLGILAVGFALTIGGGALGNGEEFFQPAGDGKVDLVYFGQIKDENGKPLDAVNVTVSVKNINMVIPIANDTIGHYRTPDIGAMVKDTGEKVDPAQLEIVASKPGYKQMKPAKITVPSKANGSVQVDFVLEKDTGATAAAN